MTLRPALHRLRTNDGFDAAGVSFVGERLAVAQSAPPPGAQAAAEVTFRLTHATGVPYRCSTFAAALAWAFVASVKSHGRPFEAAQNGEHVVVTVADRAALDVVARFADARV